MSPFVKLFYDIVHYGLEKLGRYYSDYPGFIFDNKDPLNLHRVRLIIPGIADNPMDEWAFPKGLFSGDVFGMHCIPPEGTMVWVSFRLGDPNYPLWSFGHFGQNDITNWTKDQKKINNFWFQTPQGTLIELDDEEGTMRVTDAHGNQIQTSGKGVSVIPLKGGSIFHGSLDKGDEGTAMGATTEAVATSHHKGLLGLISSVNSLSSSLNSMMEKMVLPTTTSPIIAAGFLITEAPPIIQAATNLLSNNDQITKSLDNQTPNLKKIPSTTVFLDK